MRQRSNIFQNIDWITILIFLGLLLIGWLNIYAAVYNEEHRSLFDLSQHYGKQMIWIFGALVLALVILITDAKFFSAFAYIIYGIIILLLLTVTLVGKEVAGSKSWFEIGNFSLQPSELAKFATALALAKFLSNLDLNTQRLSTKIISAAIILLPVVLILLQPDVGSAMVFSSLILVLFREGLSGKLLIAGACLAFLFVLALVINKFVLIGIAFSLCVLAFFLYKNLRKQWFKLVIVLVMLSGFILSIGYVVDNILEPHQQKRLNVLVGTETDLKGAGYNLNQSMIAIGSGGFLGKGFLQGTQTKFDFVPKQSTDFIFCTIGEEWGFIGSSVLIMLFVGLFTRIIIMAERQRSKFSRVYGYGVASILFFHFAVNIGMTIGLFPVIGVPLPFISYGGSSLWGFAVLLIVFVKLDSVRLELL
jgi:rod shape determining protein RodA